MASGTSSIVIRQIVLAFGCGLMMLPFSFVGLAVAAVIVFALPKGERLEFLCLFWLLALLPLLGILPLLIVSNRTGPFLFLGLAWLQDFFAMFRTDPNMNQSDAGPGFTTEGWYRLVVASGFVSILCGILYGYLLQKRLCAARLPN